MFPPLPVCLVVSYPHCLRMQSASAPPQPPFHAICRDALNAISPEGPPDSHRQRRRSADRRCAGPGLSSAMTAGSAQGPVRTGALCTARGCCSLGTSI